jgi:hypothetical protein
MKESRPTAAPMPMPALAATSSPRTDPEETGGPVSVGSAVAVEADDIIVGVAVTGVPAIVPPGKVETVGSGLKAGKIE